MTEVVPVPSNDVLDLEKALKRIIQTSNADCLLAKGLHEVCKAIEQKDDKLKAQYVILAKNCDEANYVKLIKGLASQNKIPIIEEVDGETLGEWLGICKYDKNKNVTKKRKCSSVAIRGFSVEAKEEEKAILRAKAG
jgi:small subunit ribosomal protein S12e